MQAMPRLLSMGFDAEFVLIHLAKTHLHAHDQYLEAARALVERCGATGISESRLSPGVTAREFGARSSHLKVKEFFSPLGAFLGRYDIDDGPPIHRSATCEVYFALDNEQVSMACMRKHEVA